MTRCPVWRMSCFHMCWYVCLQFLNQISFNNCKFSNKPVSDFCYSVISIWLYSFLQFLQLQQFRALKLRHVFGKHSDLGGVGGGGQFLGSWWAVVKISQHRLNDLVGQIINDSTTVKWRAENNKASSRVWWTYTGNVHFTKQSTKDNYVKLVQLWRISILALARSTF